MKKVYVDETGADVQDERLQVVNVEERAEDSCGLTVGESLLLIVVLGVMGFGLWAGGSYVVNDFWPAYIRPLVSDDVSCTSSIGPDLEFRSWSYREGGYLARKGGDDRLLDRVDWVMVGSGTDSMAVLSHKGKVGYVDRYTGEMVIPATFDYGWVFSEGLAGVVSGGRLMFIDRSGRTVIDRNLSAGDHDEPFIFQNGHCRVYDAVSGKVGLMGADGQWRLPPVCDGLENEGNVWIFIRDGFYGLYHKDKGVVIPAQYNHIHIVEGLAMVQSADHVVSSYDLLGHRVADIVIYEVGNLSYPTDKVAGGGDPTDVRYELSVARCRYYKVNHETGGMYWGLMDRSGRCITKPAYTHIEAIGPGRYLTWPHGVILDNAGKEQDCYDF